MTTTPSPRSAGVLLHPTSLPAPYGIGDLGPAAYAWVDALVHARQSWWQILPLGPTGYGDSPYQSLSSFAGNPYLISPDLLIQDGLLKKDDLAGAQVPRRPRRLRPGHPVQGQAAGAGLGELRRSASAGPASRVRRVHARAGRLAGRLRPVHGPQGQHTGPELARLAGRAGASASRRPWPRRAATWPRRSASTASASSCSSASGGAQGARQPTGHPADRRRADLRGQRLGRRVGQPGAVPARRGRGSPTVVAGVPPDYFSATGQLWGNPLYDWEALQGDRLRLVDRAAAGDAGAGGPGPARSLPRLRGVLGDPRRCADGRDGPLGAGPGRRLLPDASRRRWAACR